jgi:hypothetical protein
MLTVISHDLDGDVWRMELADRDEIADREELAASVEGAVDLGPPHSTIEIVFHADDDRWKDADPAEAKRLQLAEVRAAWGLDNA